MNEHPQANLPRRLVLALACGLALAPSAWSQTAPAEPVTAPKTVDEKAAKEIPIQSVPKKGEEETLELSPFRVTTERDSGYYAENTLAGSRLNSNIGDLAAAITIVTKQQLEDTASLDINDVFRFEAGTEGSSSYTPVVTDRGTAKDTVAGYTLGNDGGTTTNAQSNRVRGLGAPDAGMNFYSSNSRVPFDSYNTQSIEINRGPNSMLFGLGSPAGIVNQSTAQAAFNRNTNTVQLRTDHNGSQRASLAINRSLIEDKLAIYVAALYDNRQFERKPSYDVYRRQYGALSFRPFKNTMIRGFAENYRNAANRPNFQTPRDFVTPWLQAGRPVYDSSTRMITVLDTGVVKGPYTASAASPGFVTGNPVGQGAVTTLTSPLYIPGIQFDTPSRPNLRIDTDGDTIDYYQRQLQFYRTVWSNPQATLPTASSLGWAAGDPRYAILDRQWSSSVALPAPTTTLNGLPATYGAWQNPGVSNQSIYDWTRYNTLTANFGDTWAHNYNLELEQKITDNLYFSAGWFRQDINGWDNYTISQTTGATLQIDTNVKMPDGSANPYFGLPLLTDSAPDTFRSPERNDNYRAMLAYDLDLTKQDNFLKWLGRHRLLAMWSKQSIDRATERYRNGFDSGDADAKLRYLPNNLISGWNLWNGSQINRSYYLANPGDPQGVVSSSLGRFGNKGWDTPYTVDVTVPDQVTGVYRKVSITMKNHFSDAGSFRFARDLESYNLASQSYFLNNRLVTTVGFRRDKLNLGRTNTGQYVGSDGVLVPALSASQIYSATTGLTDYNLVMNRWTPAQDYEYDTKTYGAALKLFQGWNRIERSASEGNWIAKLARGTTLYYNASDNWNPPASVVTDYFRQVLPTPTGEDKEIGVGFSLFDNKLVARVNWFETRNHDERTGIAGTLITRLAYGDTTLMRPWAESVVRIRNGANPATNTQWNSNTTVDVSTGALLQQVWDLMKLPVDYYVGLSPGATQESVAKGTELNLTFNPNRNWTMKLTGSKTESTFASVAPQYDAWLAVRMPVWTAATAPEIADFTDINGTPYSLRNFWSSYGYSSAARLSNTDGNTNAQNYFNNTVVSQVGLAKAQEGAVAANQRKYRMSFLTNYRFTEGKLKGWSTGGSLRWESKGAVGYYGRAADPTRPQVITAIDPTRPVYLDNGRFYTDLSLGYTRKVFSDKVVMRIQLNANNIFEDGHLDPIAVNYDGTPWAYRIIDPRQFILTTTFTF
jgi:hypothetical protein